MHCKADGLPLDLFEESQQPFCATAWRARREKRDRQAAANSKDERFTKLDFISLVLSKGLASQHAVLRYVQARRAIIATPANSRSW